MTSELSLQQAGTAIELTLKASLRARVMRLKVDSRTGAVTLTYPRHISKRKALHWATEQKEWIETAVAAVPAAVPISPGGELPVEGRPRRIDWDERRSRLVKLEADRLLLGGPIETVEPRILRWLKQHARKLLEQETREFAAKASVAVSRVGIGDPLSRWGSCSTSGSIRYSWRLILAPDWVRRATVAHEVAHRVHMNHGPHFHELVETLLESDPKPARLWLRREGAKLHRIGVSR